MWTRLLYIVCGSLIIGCSSMNERGELLPPPEIRNRTVGKWTNVHKGDSNLLGFRVQQFPDCQYEAPEYEGRHPAMIIYVFKDLRWHQMSFAPDGTVEEDFWGKNAPDWLIETLEKPRDGS